MGEQPLFEMVALAAHVRPTLSTARNDSVTRNEERNLAQTERDGDLINMCNFTNIRICRTKSHF